MSLPHQVLRQQRLLLDQPRPLLPLRGGRRGEDARGVQRGNLQGLLHQGSAVKDLFLHVHTYMWQRQAGQWMEGMREIEMCQLSPGERSEDTLRLQHHLIISK